MGGKVSKNFIVRTAVIDRKELYEKYMSQVNEIAEKCDWKASFSPYEIVNIIVNIIEKDYKVEPLSLESRQELKNLNPGLTDEVIDKYEELTSRRFQTEDLEERNKIDAERAELFKDNHDLGLI